MTPLVDTETVGVSGCCDEFADGALERVPPGSIVGWERLGILAGELVRIGRTHDGSERVGVSAATSTDMRATVMQMARTTVDVDALDAARAALGTQGVSATINSALRAVARRHALTDFDVLHDVDGTLDEVRSGRAARGGHAPA